MKKSLINQNLVKHLVQVCLIGLVTGSTALAGVTFKAKQQEIDKELWKSLFPELSAVKNATYIEVNPVEGQTTAFVFEQILTGVSSRGVLLLNEEDINHKKLAANIKASGLEQKITIFAGGVESYLKSSQPNKFDLVVMNSEMLAKYISKYLHLAWSSLKVGGYIVFWPQNKEKLPTIDNPKSVLYSFLPMFFDEVETIRKTDLVVLRKRKNPCSKLMNCYFLVNSTYLPLEKKLVNLDANKKFNLTDSEVEILNEYLNNTRKPGESELTVFSHLKGDIRLKALVERTGLAIKL